tara:strand:- start:144 stop:344 length:201 start_codon:yes stop_codon:yes gene_type:complete
MKVGSLVKRKMLFDDWVKYADDWMKFPKYQETGIIIRIGRAGYWDYEVLWPGEYKSHDESELEEVV